MEAIDKRWIERAATIDERLSGDFETLPGRKDDADLAGRRLAAWCRSSANGDWALFNRRLERDGLSMPAVLSRFATLRRRSAVPETSFAQDAAWIFDALRSVEDQQSSGSPVAFEQLLLPVVEGAQAMLRNETGAARGVFSESAQESLAQLLLEGLSDLFAAPLYELFAKDRAAGYRRFVSDMKAEGFRKLFDEKPVLLRLAATLTRQWIDTSRELVDRLAADLDLIRRELLPLPADARVTGVEGSRSDRHNDGHSVIILTFEDGSRLVYKPKDLRLDTAWHAMVSRLNQANPPFELRAVRAIARGPYGWTEFIEHRGCEDDAGPDLFFRRAGGWLALFHCFAATDMHQENIIAAGAHPVPIDLETLLQASSPAPGSDEPSGAAFAAAADMIANSVMRVGLLPAYGRGPDNSVFAMGGLTSDWNARIEIGWDKVNSDDMRPVKRKVVVASNPNLPHVGGAYAKFADHFDAFIKGFEDYAGFLSRQRGASGADMFEGFAGLPIRKVPRPTRFYSMLLQRLKAHRHMEDGAIWSAEADFIARFANWNEKTDPNWPLHRAERAALLTLNVPHFTSPSDGSDISDAGGVVAHTDAVPGLTRARARFEAFDAGEVAWQSAVIRANAEPAKVAANAAQIRSDLAVKPSELKKLFAEEADAIAAELSDRAIRKGEGAAWIGLDWLGDAEAYQLVPLGAALYNGVSGIGVFFAAHGQVAAHAPSTELAYASVAYLRTRLKDWNAARFARSLGIGGAAGLSSIVYALTAMSKSLDDDGLLADAHAASRLITDDLIASDKRLDVIGGSAGAILCLLRLYRDTKASDVLERAIKCGDHLLRQDRVGVEGKRSFVGEGFGAEGLNGMSHGAAGFAYALAALAGATGRDDFAKAASEALAFENASYDSERKNWPDRRHDGEPGWACRWCHGAPGIGMARAAMLRQGFDLGPQLENDIGNALAGTENGWPSEIDTLCCGTLGSVEFFCEAADALGRPEIAETAAKRLATVLQAAHSAGDYRWNSGKRQFNLGMFRGLAGVGYTLLRRLDDKLPNALIWE